MNIPSTLVCFASSQLGVADVLSTRMLCIDRCHAHDLTLTQTNIVYSMCHWRGMCLRQHYVEQRRLQITADLQPPPSFLQSYQAYLAQVRSTLKEGAEHSSRKTTSCL
jgi:hypothetical protein